MEHSTTMRTTSMSKEIWTIELEVDKSQEKKKSDIELYRWHFLSDQMEENLIIPQITKTYFYKLS